MQCPAPTAEGAQSQEEDQHLLDVSQAGNHAQAEPPAHYQTPQSFQAGLLEALTAKP